MNNTLINDNIELTKLVTEKLPRGLQIYLLKLYMNLENGDPIHFFKLTSSGGASIQKITHITEEPEYSKVEFLEIVDPIEDDEIYIIDRGNKIVMMFAQEY